MLNAFNLKESKLLKGVDPKGLFSDHLAPMRYSNLFKRIVKGIYDNDPNTHGNK
jgi:hypothetical protein